MIVTIDGPAGAGKSTAARSLAERLGFRFLDTGATYRAVALAGLRHKVDWGRPNDLAALAARLSIELEESRVLLDGEDVAGLIRTVQITALTHYAANNAKVREVLVQLQRRTADDFDVVAEGRDQGTVVFPKAECKIFLTATAAERARRRFEDLRARGEPVSFDEVLADQELRDQRDATREVGPLVMAPDAIEFLTDQLGPGQVVDRLEALVREKLGIA